VRVLLHRCVQPCICRAWYPWICEVQVPHFVCIKSPSIVFPDCCAYCKSTTSSSAFSQPYSKISGKGFPVVLTGQTWPAMLPACDRCARWFSKVRKAYFFFGIGGLICGTLGFIAFNIMLEFMGLFVNDARIYLPLVLALCSLIAWSILWAVRASELRKPCILHSCKPSSCSPRDVR
jgi:hypothetical protein